MAPRSQAKTRKIALCNNAARSRRRRPPSRLVDRPKAVLREGCWPTTRPGQKGQRTHKHQGMAKPGARAGLARALDELERAERNYEEPELATKAAAGAAAAAVRLMRKRPNDSAAQQAGLEALVLATSVPSRVDAALDAGAAAVVQRAAARFCARRGGGLGDVSSSTRVRSETLVQRCVLVTVPPRILRVSSEF